MPWEEICRCKRYGSANICSSLLWCSRQKNLCNLGQFHRNGHLKQWPDDNPITSLWTLARRDLWITLALDIQVFLKILNHLQGYKIKNKYNKTCLRFFSIKRKINNHHMLTWENLFRTVCGYCGHTQPISSFIPSLPYTKSTSAVLSLSSMELASRIWKHQLQTMYSGKRYFKEGKQQL